MAIHEKGGYMLSQRVHWLFVCIVVIVLIGVFLVVKTQPSYTQELVVPITAPDIPQNVVILHPSDDAYIYSSDYIVTKGIFLKLGYEDGWGIARSMLRFDLTSIPAGATINDAELALYSQRFSSTATVDRYFEARRITDVWAENLATHWGEYYDSIVYDTATLHGSTSEWITWDIVDLVSAWHNGTYANHGVMLIGQDESIVDNTLFILYSRDYSNSTYHPVLTVTYTPASPPDIRGTTR